MHRRTPARICLTLISTRGAPFPQKEVNESHKKKDPCTYLFLTNGGIVGRTGGGIKLARAMGNRRTGTI